MSRIATDHFFADLQATIAQHCTIVAREFQPLTLEQAAWQPGPREWSVLQCFDHLNLTHDYYRPRIAAVLARPELASRASEGYVPSRWGRIYMYFALNPRWSFPVPAQLAPVEEPSTMVLEAYLQRQDMLLVLLARAESADLCLPTVPIERGVRFSLGDCLKIVVEHDALHVAQAQGVQAAYLRR